MVSLGGFYSDSRLHDRLRTETVFGSPLAALRLTQAARSGLYGHL